jgi:hypothetical protein
MSPRLAGRHKPGPYVPDKRSLAREAIPWAGRTPPYEAGVRVAYMRSA